MNGPLSCLNISRMFVFENFAHELITIKQTPPLPSQKYPVHSSAIVGSVYFSYSCEKAEKVNRTQLLKKSTTCMGVVFKLSLHLVKEWFANSLFRRQIL